MISSSQAGLLALTVIMIVIPSLATAIRCWGMAVIKGRKNGWDDYTAIAALVRSAGRPDFEENDLHQDHSHFVSL